MMKSVLTAALALCAALPAAAPAFAQEMRSVRLHYGDLDLASDRGVAALHARVLTALSDVCGDADRHDLANVGPIARCRTDAMVGAREQMARAVAHARVTVASR